METQLDARASRVAAPQRRAFWLKHLHRWHWISSALCLIGMMLFAITGFTLNHAARIDAHPVVERRVARLPERLARAVERQSAAANGDASSDTKNDAKRDAKKSGVPDLLANYLDRELGVDTHGRAAEWSGDEVYIALPRPGGDAWVSVDLGSGEVQYELTTRGWISYLNDLHKGRNTGVAWSLFLDVFALACLIFSITGLFLLKLHARNRGATWPLVGLGLVVPLVLAIIFIH